MSNKRILCVGLVCVDLIQMCHEYPKEDSDQRSIDCRWQRGGNASNNCTVLSKCGQRSEFFGTVSDDMMGEFVKQDFENHHIITKNVVICPKQTCPFSSVIINVKNGSRTIIHSNKNMPELTLEDLKKLDLQQYNWIHFEGRNVKQVILMLKYISNYNSSKKCAIKTSVEFEKPKEELISLLPIPDVVFIGKDFAKFQGCKDKYDALSKNILLVKPSASVIVAWGESGAVAQSTDGALEESAAFLSEPGHVVDTLGAGDTFVGSTILCLARGFTLKESITTGCRVAGAKVTMAGFSAINPTLITNHQN